MVPIWFTFVFSLNTKRFPGYASAETDELVDFYVRENPIFVFKRLQNWTLTQGLFNEADKQNFRLPEELPVIQAGVGNFGFALSAGI